MADWAQNTDFLPSLRRYRTTPRQTDRHGDSNKPSLRGYDNNNNTKRSNSEVEVQLPKRWGICMHIHNHSYTDALTHTRVHAAMHVHSHTHNYTDTLTHTRARAHTHTHTQLYRHNDTHAHARAHTPTLTLGSACAPTHPHTHAHTYAHTRARM